MNIRRLLLTLAFSSVLSVPAMAATAVMVQFGSFETQEEAQARLDSVKGKYSGVLNSMPLAVREVMLPPDNLKVYRTQAGPVPTRNAAQAICTQLASGGDECYVAETVIVGNAAPAAIMDAPVTSATVVPPSSVNPAVMAPAVIGDVRMANATSAPAPLPAPTNDAMNNAMDQAIAEQAAAPAPVVVSQAPERSFWSRMNPFSSSKPAPVPAAAEMTVAPSPMAAPVEMVASAPIAAASVAPMMPLPAPATEPASVIVAEPVAQTTPVIAPAPKLLPPPAPLMAQTSAPMPIAPVAPSPVIARTVPPVDPIAVSNVPFKTGPSVNAAQSGEQSRSNSSNVTLGNAEVRVEEATRVPLTDSMTMSAQQMTPVTLYPAATLGKRTLWAQIGVFDDSQAALAFWERYKMAHPDFPAVRVRVTSPVLAARRGNDKVWLRVGPFGQTGFISNLCSTIQNPAEGVNVPEADTQVKCGRITDMGFADTGSRAPGMLPGSRYNR